MARSRQKRQKGEQGPPDALTPDAHELIVQAVRNGAYLVHAAGFAGINPETLRRWMRNADGPKPERPDYINVTQHRKAVSLHRRCVALSGDMQKAESHFVLSQLQIIRQAAASGRSWQAAAWLLERRYRDLFSLRTEVTGAEGGPVEMASDPTADLERLEATLTAYAERLEQD